MIVVFLFFLFLAVESAQLEISSELVDFISIVSSQQKQAICKQL